MNKIKMQFSTICCLFLFACQTARQTEELPLSSYVNPFVGATTNTEAAGSYHGLGKTFPGATASFRMVQVSPTTITGGDNGPGYSDEHTTIEGFAFTQMSGIGWYGDLGYFLSDAQQPGRRRGVSPLDGTTAFGLRNDTLT